MNTTNNLTDPRLINRLKLKHIEHRLLCIIGISTALEHDFKQAADTNAYKPLDDTSHGLLTSAIKQLANDVATDLNGLE